MSPANSNMCAMANNAKDPYLILSNKVRSFHNILLNAQEDIADMDNDVNNITSRIAIDNDNNVNNKRSDAEQRVPRSALGKQAGTGVEGMMVVSQPRVSWADLVHASSGKWKET